MIWWFDPSRAAQPAYDAYDEGRKALAEEDLDTALAAVNRAVENCIAIDPAQYLWSYRRFKKQPEGAAPFYDFK